MEVDQRFSGSNPSADDSHISAAWAIRRLKGILFPDDEFLRKKFEDHRRFTALFLGILAVFLALLWGWDYITDPVGAQRTIGLRLTFLLVFPLAIGFWDDDARYRFLGQTMPATLLLSEAVFLEILKRLDSGMIHGIAGFMYAMLIALLAGQGFSLFVAVGYTLAAAALPQILAVLGLADGFPQLRYAILLWPAAGLTVLTQLALADNYLRRYRLEQRLKSLSETDPLSGVGNRRRFMRLLGQEIERARRLGQELSLLVLDIDHFKRVNDSHGHPTGDSVIRHVADICRHGVRSIDTVGRIGGEEFAVLLIGTPAEPAADAAARLREAIESAVVPSTADLPVRFTASIGVAQLSAGDKGPDDLFARADAALYTAKREGRNRVVCLSDSSGPFKQAHALRPLSPEDT